MDGHGSSGQQKDGSKPSYVLLAAGSNSAGQLGNGTTDDAHRLHRCVFSSTTTTTASNAAFPPAGWQIVQLSSGAGHTVALLQRIDSHDADAPSTQRQERQVWVCGSGKEGQLGAAHCDGAQTAFVQLDCDALPLQAFGVSADEGAVPWTPKHITCGWSSTLLAFERLHGDDDDNADDLLLVLGRVNDFGQLGRGRGAEAISAVGRIVLTLPSSENGGRLRVDALASGLRHALVLCSSSSTAGDPAQRHVLFGWGAARHGQLVDNVQSDHPPAKVWSPQLLRSWSSGADDSTAGHLSAGKEHSAVCIPSHWMAADEDRQPSTPRLQVWGSNRSGQLDLKLPLSGHPLLDVQCTWNGTMGLCDGGAAGGVSVIGAGSNAKGQLGTHDTQSTANATQTHSFVVPDSEAATAAARTARLACGSEHTLLLLPLSSSSARVIGWGWNEHGNLAQGDEQDRHEPVQVWPAPVVLAPTGLPPDARPTNVWAGCGTSFIQVVVVSS